MIRSRPATPADEPELLRLASEPMPGSVRIRYDYALGYANAEAMKGDDVRVLVVEDTASGRIMGAATRALRRVWLGGRIARVAYLSGLRSFPEFRGGLGFFRGWRAMRTEMESDPADLTLTTVLSGNTRARALFTSGRAGLPSYVSHGKVATFVFAPTSRSAPDRSAADIGELSEFYRREAPRRDLFPAFGASLPHGLVPGDFAAVRTRGRIVAAGALWRHGSRRRLVVDGYSRPLSIARPFVNVAARILRSPRLPPPGGELKCCYLACALAADAESFRRLVDAARALLREGECLVLSLHSSDPLCSALDGTKAWRYESELFCVSFGAVGATAPAFIHIEAGEL